MATAVVRRTCDICETTENIPDWMSRVLTRFICSECERIYPSPLVRAHTTNISKEYVLQLRAGKIFIFSSAVITGDYVVLRTIDADNCPAIIYDNREDLEISVRVSEIEWCMEHPEYEELYGSAEADSEE